MKSFKEYLTESKKVYEFKVKVAGEHPKDFTEQIKRALAQYKVESCAAGKSTPIQERQSDFPNHKNVHMTIFEVSTSYPVNSVQVRDAIAAVSGVPTGSLKVSSLAEEAEYELNHANDTQSGESLLGKEYDKESHQDIVGEKHVMSFLKELGGKDRTTGTAYTGVNDQLLAKSAPVEKTKDKK